ncbi:hypothetical protein K1T71_015160, partial [Dendrolimus kikuchii]
LLSCCLVQKGNDTVGLLGFLYKDIVAEVARAKKHKCSYCFNYGASIGCCFAQCRKQFHLPCGRERNTKIPENIMAKARSRKRLASKCTVKKSIEQSADLEAVCVICYEEVDGYPTTETFWPPCCAKDAWFHRTCLQRMSLSAGMHYLKCPLCNDKENFYRAVKDQGYYIPDRDAAWELEQNAFAEIYERPIVCNADECECTMGPSHDAENGPWEIKLCILCGSSGIHAQCQRNSDSANANGRYVCTTCQPAAPADLESLAESLEAVILAEQSRSTTRTRHGPFMPSRMSLRRTKGRAPCRLELNLKPPKRLSLSLQKVKFSSSPITSPTKLLEQCVKERSDFLDIKMVLNENVVEKVRRKLLKPRPLMEKTRIVNKILDIILINEEEPLKEWCSPEKSTEIKANVLEDSTLSSELNGPLQQENDNTFYCETAIETNCDTERHTSDIENDVNMNNVQEDTSENGIDKEDYSIIKVIINENSQIPKSKNDLDELHEEENSQIIDMLEISEQDTDSKSIVSNLNMYDMSEKSTARTISDTNELTNESDLIYNETCDPERVVVKDLHEIIHTESPIEDLNEISNKENLIINTIKVLDQKNLDEDINKKLEEDLQIFSTPKNLKTIHIENDSSIEISKDNQIINIDVVKMDSAMDNFKLPALKSPVKNKKCFLKFSATDKEILQNTNFNLDLESFKNHYLNEVDGDRSKSKNIVNINTDISIKRRNLRKRKLEGGMKTSKKNKRRKVNTQNSTINNNVSKEVSRLNTLQLNNNDIKQEIQKDTRNFLNTDNIENIPDIEQNTKTRRRKRTKDNKRIKRKVTKSKDTSVKLSLKNKNNVQLAIDTEKDSDVAKIAPCTSIQLPVAKRPRKQAKNNSDEEFAVFKDDIKCMLEDWKNTQNSLLNKLIHEVADIKDQNNQIKQSNEEIEKSLDFLNLQYEDIKLKVQGLETERKEYLQHITFLETKIEDMERNAKLSSIEIRNVPLINKAETKTDLCNIVQNTCKALNVIVPQVAIRDVYRLNKKNTKSSTIIADFTSVILKNEVIQGIKNYNNQHPGHRLSSAAIGFTYYRRHMSCN